MEWSGEEVQKYLTSQKLTSILGESHLYVSEEKTASIKALHKVTSIFGENHI